MSSSLANTLVGVTGNSGDLYQRALQIGCAIEVKTYTIIIVLAPAIG